MLSFDANAPYTQNYKLLIGSILPRPIAVVSTLNLDGSYNLAPFSFFTAVSASPMIIAFCPLIRSKDGAKKDTVLNIERSREFVIQICTEDIAEKVNLASTELPYGVSEFEYAKLTPMPSLKVGPPRVKESPIHFECKLRDILNYGDHPGGGRLITGEVLVTHVANDIMEDGKIITSKLKPIGRGAGNDWITCNNMVQLERKMQQQIQK